MRREIAILIGVFLSIEEVFSFRGCCKSWWPYSAVFLYDLGIHAYVPITSWSSECYVLETELSQWFSSPLAFWLLIASDAALKFCITLNGFSTMLCKSSVMSTKSCWTMNGKLYLLICFPLKVALLLFLASRIHQYAILWMRGLFWSSVGKASCLALHTPSM